MIMGVEFILRSRRVKTKKKTQAKTTERISFVSSHTDGLFSPDDDDQRRQVKNLQYDVTKS